MPLDMSIYSRVAQPDLTNALAGLAQIPQQRMQNRLMQMQMQEANQKLADDAALRQVYRNALSPTGEIDYSKAAQSAAAAGSGNLVPGLIKQQQEQRAQKIKMASDALTLQKHYAGQVMAAPTLANAMASLDQMEQVTGQGSMEAERQQLASIGDNPEAIKQWAAGHALDAEKMLPHFAMTDVGGSLQQVGTNPITGAITQGATIQKTMAPGQAEQLKQQQQQFGVNTALKRQELANAGRKLENEIRTTSPEYQASVAAAKEAASGAVKKQQEQTASVQDSNAGLDLIEKMKGIVDNTSNGALSRGANAGLSALGWATDTRVNDRKLETMANQLALHAQRFPGVQTDKDYDRMLAQVGVINDTNATVAEKTAALSVAEDSFNALIKRYGGKRTTENAAPTQPGAPLVGGFKYLGKE